jgi:glyoxylase-like metal-dependent hydrolase (beta-lactamase superfamily II)
MQRVASSLYASPPEAVPFGPSLVMRAFLLRREPGNLLIYRAGTVSGDQKTIDQLGGISRQYLSHRHEAAPVCDWVAETFHAPLYCHADDAESASAGCAVARTFSERHRLDDDFEIIPTPGHTSGATAYLWDSGEHRCLFTGDTIFFPQGEWRALLLRSNAPPPLDGASDREQYLESLELLRSIDFDLLLPSLATAGQPYYTFVEQADATRRIDAIIERVQRGDNG